MVICFDESIPLCYHVQRRPNFQIRRLLYGRQARQTLVKNSEVSHHRELLIVH